MNELNNFSLISRLFGNLYYRRPTDEILVGVFGWLQQGNLRQVWALEEDSASQNALEALQMPLDLTLLAQEYDKLFGEKGKISPKISDYGINVVEFAAFRLERGMPETADLDHFAHLLLTASWLEDNVDSAVAQQQLFAQFLLPCAAQFLRQVEEKASLPFYRSLALLTHELLSATADELEESE